MKEGNEIVGLGYPIYEIGDHTFAEMYLFAPRYLVPSLGIRE